MPIKATSPVHGTINAQHNREAGQGVVVTVDPVVEVNELEVAVDTVVEVLVRVPVTVSDVVVHVYVVGNPMSSRLTDSAMLAAPSEDDGPFFRVHDRCKTTKHTESAVTPRSKSAKGMRQELVARSGCSGLTMVP